MSHLVFTYGTLQAGERNHERYMQGTAIIAEAKTVEPTFIMLQFESATSPGKFTPGVVRVPEGGAHIAGQLFEADDEAIMRLDILEGVGEKYDREKITLDTGHEAWIYLRRGQGDPAPSPHIVYDGIANSYRWNEKRAPAL